MIGHAGRVDDIYLAGEEGSDLRKQVEWETVKRGLRWTDVMTQDGKHRAYIVHCGFHLKIMVRQEETPFRMKMLRVADLWKRLGMAKRG